MQTPSQRRPLSRLQYSVDDLDFGTGFADVSSAFDDEVDPINLGSGELAGNTTVQDGYLQSSNYEAGVSGWQLTPEGGEFNFPVALGAGSTIGGFEIGADYIRDVADSMGLASTVTGSDDTRFWAGTTFLLRASAPLRITESGVIYASNVVISGGTISGTPITSIPNDTQTIVSLLEKTWTMVFSVTDNNTIAWTSGTITLSNGRTFSINSGNTGNMAAITYIYLDPAVSSTALQTTTTAATAMGGNKILIGSAQNNSVTASFIPYGPGQPLVDGANIGALSITASQIAASTITAAKLTVSQLSAIAADLGTITAGTITGATIRTAASGTRFQMTSSAFQGINSSGTVIFEIILSGGNAGDVIFGDDASGQYAMWDNSAGTFKVFASNIAIPTVQVFTSSGTWNKPSGLDYAIIKAWGGGGSGGSGASPNYHGATGGGGGCYMERTLQAASLSSSHTVTIGDGGAAVATGNNGNVGGNTTFGALLTAYGGGGGKACSNNVGDESESGGYGGNAFSAGSAGVQRTGFTGVDPDIDFGLFGEAVVGGNGGGGFYSGAGGGVPGAANSAGTGGNSVKGGAGGGGAHQSGVGSAGGTSIDGGNGGAGSDSTNGTAGSVRGGGGGACSSGGSSGAGGKGYLEVWHFYA